jgi:hypothetical protein
VPSCSGPSSGPHIAVTADKSVEGGDAIRLRIQNFEGEPICIAQADFEVPGEMTHLLPQSREDYIENRQPPVVLKGFDLTDGLVVVPGKSGRDVYLDLSRLNGRTPPPAVLHGVVRAVKCGAFFKDTRPAVAAENYSVEIRH